jgi:hypothetical protein
MKMRLLLRNTAIRLALKIILSICASINDILPPPTASLNLLTLGKTNNRNCIEESCTVHLYSTGFHYNYSGHGGLGKFHP